jgi:hypothetical protein
MFSSPFLPARLQPPTLFRLALHGGGVRVLHLQPIGRAAGTVGGILALRDDAFGAKLAGVGNTSSATATFSGEEK